MNDGLEDKITKFM